MALIYDIQEEVDNNYTILSCKKIVKKDNMFYPRYYQLQMSKKTVYMASVMGIDIIDYFKHIVEECED